VAVWREWRPPLLVAIAHRWSMSIDRPWQPCGSAASPLTVMPGRPKSR